MGRLIGAVIAPQPNLGKRRIPCPEFEIIQKYDSAVANQVQISMVPPHEDGD